MSDSSELDPRTPVIIGVGQVSDPIDAPDYHRWGAVDLAAQASLAALADAGLDPSLIDTVAGVRQFEISTPFAIAPLGKSNNYPRSVAGRIGADPERAILEVAGGQSPQHLVTELASAIAAGDLEVALAFGSEAISTTRAWAGREGAPDYTETAEGSLEDRGYGLEGLIDQAQIEHDLRGAPEQYALFENARRHRLGLPRDDYVRQLGELFAPFTEVAARNPYAAAPTRRSAEELMTPTERNRMIADPYPRFVVSRDQVNQGAAVILSSVAAARAAGIAESKWVYLHGYADLREKDLMDRPDLSGSPAAVAAAKTALGRAGVGVDELATLDLYSCFPIAVLNICDGLGLSHTDPRGLTLTGGLPFFGGAGNNYSMHAIAETVDRLRAEPGAFGFVGANGGLLSKYSVGVYSTLPREWVSYSDAEQQDELNGVPSVEHTAAPEGPATVETYTVKFGRDGNTAIVVGRLGDGTRFLATSEPGDDQTIAALLGEQPFGRPLTVRVDGAHTFVRVTD